MMARITMHIAFIFCLIGISAMEIKGQHIRKYSKNSRELTFAENLDVAEGLFELQLFYPSMRYYEKAKSIDDIDPEKEYHLAECYRKLRYYSKAAESYRLVSERDPESFPEALLYQGTMNLAAGNLSGAKDKVAQYLEANQGAEQGISSFAAMQLKNVSYAMDGIKKQNKISIEGLDSEINQPQTTFSAFKWQDKKLLYSTAITVSSPLQKNYPGFKGIYDTVYVNRLWQGSKVDEQWSDPEMMDIQPASEFLSIGSPFWVEKQKRLYYTMCSNVDENRPCQIYYSEQKKNGSWSKGIALDKTLNQQNSSSKHPMILGYEAGFIIFFSSDRKGGFGGFDLWYTKMDKKGAIADPINLGPAINTPYDEVSPFLHEKSRNLFFSSNGHIGYGELDVFMIRLDLKRKTGKVYHLDYPINSTTDDYYFSVNADGFSGFLSSNRSSDLYASYTSHADKLYEIRFEPPFSFSQLPNYLTEVNAFSEAEAELNLFNEAFAYQYLDNSETVLEAIEEQDVNLSGQLLFGEDPFVNRNVLLENEEGQVVGQTMSDEDGYFEFRGLPSDESYMLVLEAEDADMTISLNYQDEQGNTISSFNSKESSDFYRFRNLENYFSSMHELTNEDESAFALDEEDIEKHLKPFMTPQAYKDLESGFTEDIFEKILIRVQIGAYRHPKAGLFRHLNGIGKIDEDYVDDMTKFLVGKFDRIAEAEPLRLAVHDQGIEDAFIAIYYKGKRVSAIYY